MPEILEDLISYWDGNLEQEMFFYIDEKGVILTPKFSQADLATEHLLIMKNKEK